MVNYMKIQMKRWMAAGLCLTMLLSGGGMLLAADTTIPTIVKTYTLEEIKTLSGLHATQVLTQEAENKITDANRFSAEMDYYDALYAASIVGAPGADSMLEVARMSYDNAIENQQNAEDALLEVQLQAEYDGESRFLAYLEMEDTLAQMDKTLALQAEMLRIEKVKLMLGMTTQISVDKIALQISELKTNIAAMKNAKILAGFELMNQIGQPEDTVFVLAGITEYPVLKEIFDYETLSETAYLNSLTLKQLNNAIEDLEEDIDEGNLFAAQKDQLAAQEDKLKLSRSQFSYTLKVLTQNGMYNLAASQTNLDLLKGKLALAQKTLDQTKLMIRLGAAAPYTLLNSELEFLTAQNNYEKAVHDRYLSLRSLNLLEQGVVAAAPANTGSSEV